MVMRETIDQGALEAAIAARLPLVNPIPYQQGGISDVLTESAFPLSPHSESATLSHLAFTVDVTDAVNTRRRQQRTELALATEVQVTLCYHVRPGDDSGLFDKRQSLHLCAAVLAAIKLNQEPAWPPPGVVSVIPDRVGRLVTLSDPSFILRVCTFEVHHDLALIPL